MSAIDNVGNTANSEPFTIAKDSTAPTLSIQAPAQPGLLFGVAWESQDDLTGVEGFDVEYRQGAGGSWTRWFTDTTETEAEFNGSDGQAYTFRVRASDGVGNQSAWEESSAASVQTVTKYYVFNGKRVAQRQGSEVYY